MKRKFISAILSVVLICSVASIFAFASTSKLGDLNNDGVITPTDARLALRAAAKLDVLDNDALKAADVNFDSKVTATDARLILRVAAKLDVFPNEPSSEPDTEPDSKPVEPTEPDTGVIVEVYPEIINTFLSGKYYLDGAFVEGDETTALKIATNKKVVEMTAAIDDVDISVMSDSKNIYLKFTGKDNVKYYLDETAISALQVKPAELGFSASKVFGGFLFTPVNRLVAPILTTEEVDGEKYSVYSFEKQSGGDIVFTFDSDKNLVKISGVDSNGTTKQAITVNSISADIPSDALTLNGFKKGSVMNLYPLLSK